MSTSRNEEMLTSVGQEDSEEVDWQAEKVINIDEVKKNPKVQHSL